MAKTIRQRAAAALAAAALAFSGIPKTVLHVSAIDPTHSPDALFWSDAENDQLSAISKDDWTVNQLYAKLNYAEIENDTVQGENVNVPDNTYYLLVHALISGEDKYQLIPVTNEEMGFGSEGFTDGHSAWVGDFESQDFNAKADLVEGILLKNSDPSSPLTEAQAISRSGCTAVQEIEGRKLNWDGGMNKRRVDSRYTNTFESYSVTGGHLAEIRVFDSDGWTPSYIQNGKEMNYYTLVT
ncbi:MAG: hypothetical protein J6S92_02165, partial [Oscillospiraceae bacterium]|nr:hypothetical protein [Oscillospiraceae bacterium]